MAERESISRALDGVREAVFEAVCVGEALEVAAGVFSPPPWVTMYVQRVEAVRRACEALESVIVFEVLA